MFSSRAAKGELLLDYGTSETSAQDLLVSPLVNYYLDYRTSETPTRGTIPYASGNYCLIYDVFEIGTPNSAACRK